MGGKKEGERGKPENDQMEKSGGSVGGKSVENIRNSEKIEDISREIVLKENF